MDYMTLKEAASLLCSAHAFSHIHWLSACVPRCMLLLDKEASNRKQEIDYQHHTIP